MTSGIYIHIPFCKTRCSYCDFATDVWRSDDAVERYVSALCLEIERFNGEDRALAYAQPSATDARSTVFDDRRSSPNDCSLLTVHCSDTVYFGGGTPSLLSAAQLERILKTVHSKFNVSAESEITLEMNPATVTLEKLNDFRSLGVNRASFGVQTFDDHSLKLLARGHDANDARNTFELLRKAKFENISFDLIAGLPHQTLADWKINLSEAMNFSPEHISLYILEIHEGTPLAEQIRTKRQPQPDEDLSGEMYETMLDKLAENGFEQYEISNFSRPGYQSKHNSKYWRCEPVFGFGVSAHSFDGKYRSANERDTARYVSLVEDKESVMVEHNEVSPKQLSAEFAFLNLRLTKGLDLRDYQETFGVDLEAKYADDFAQLKELGLIRFTNDRLQLTRKGMVFSNEVFSLFV